MHAFDLVAIGGGAGGLAAARAAAIEGKRAAIVSDAPIGGDCTWTGCVPSKTLIAAAAQGETFAGAMARVRTAVLHIAATENAETLEAEGVTVIEGRGVLEGEGRISVDGRAVEAGGIVLATGGSPSVPPIPGLRDMNHLTNENVWDLGEAPDRLGVLGGGPIGCELAQAMARLGVRVTLFEMEPRLLPREEPEASAVVQAALERDGVDVIVGAPVSEVRANGTEGAATLAAAGRMIEVDKVLVAVGRRPSTADMGLERAGVELTEQGHIKVDKALKTTADDIWAVGDVNGLLPFTHAADEQGRLAAWAAVGRRMRWTFDAGRVPWTTFTSPEVARVGVSEAQAPRGAKVAYLPMGENDRAIAEGRTDGFIKIIAGPRRFLRNIAGGQIVGATIVGDRAGEMIHEPAMMMLLNAFTGRLAQLTHAYPTWSTGVQKCAGQFFQEIEGRSARDAVRARPTMSAGPTE